LWEVSLRKFEPQGLKPVAILKFMYGLKPVLPFRLTYYWLVSGRLRVEKNFGVNRLGR
jgi:hypothetical protein